MEQNPIQESIQVNQEQDEDTKKNSNEIAEIQPTILKESIEGNNPQMIEVSKDNNTESKDTITTTRSKTQSNPQLVLKVPFRTKNKYCKKDFDVLSLAGKGAYAKVVKARYLPDGKGTLKGIKVMEIDAMERNNKLYQVYLENEVLMDLSHPNIVNIDGIFEEKRRIHIVLEYCSKGDFSDFLRVNHPLREGTIRFFASEMVNVLGYLQEKKIVHRDLKPENILLDDNCHLKVIDFATAKIIGKVFNKETMTFEDETLIEKSNKTGNDNNYEEKINESIRHTFKPEFINRIDEIIIFKPLNKEVVHEILNNIIKNIELRLRDKQLTLTVSDRAKEYIIENSFDVNFGARPIKRYVSRNIETLIANALITDEIVFRSNVNIDVNNNGEFYITK